MVAMIILVLNNSIHKRLPNKLLKVRNIKSFSIILIKLLALNKKKQMNFEQPLKWSKSLDYNTVISQVISLYSPKVQG